MTKSQRGMAKTVNFGVIYGMSAIGLSTRLAIPRKEAEEFIDQYFARYPKVLEYQQQLLANVARDGRSDHDPRPQAPLRPDRDQPEVELPRPRHRREREAINMEIQGSAADLMKTAMLGGAIATCGRKMREPRCC